MFKFGGDCSCTESARSLETRGGYQNKATHYNITLVGQPNVGKSTIFNFLTGMNQRVGNWPGKTIDRHEGQYSYKGKTYRVVDLPGLYCLTSSSEEERIAAQHILNERPEVLVVVGDASSLERSLFFLGELFLFEQPTVFVLNMSDVAERRGLAIDSRLLSQELGIPVIPMIARRGKNIDALRETLEAMVSSKQKPNAASILGEDSAAQCEIKEIIGEAQSMGQPQDWVVTRLIENDQEVWKYFSERLSADSFSKLRSLVGLETDMALELIDSRCRQVGSLVKKALVRKDLGRETHTDRIDKYVTHPFLGLLFLSFVFAIVFGLTFVLATPIQEWLDHNLIGSLRFWVMNSLSASSPRLASLVGDGVLAGVGVVVTFVPVLFVFYLALAFLEDTGYLVRAAYVMDRLMQKIGLHGKSALPLFLGLGCNVPAIMGSRVVESKAGRLLTIVISPLVPCSARLTIIAFLAPIFFGASAFLVSVLLVMTNFLILGLAGAILSKIMLRGERIPFVMELPPYHWPNLRTVSNFVRENVTEFLQKAAGLIMVFSVLLWAVSNFPGNTLEESYLGSFGRAIAPSGALIGLDWRLVVALLTSFLARENSIATLGILYGTNTDAGIADAVSASVSPLSGLVFMVVSMLFVPCAPTVSAIKQETKSWSWTIGVIVMMIVVSVLVGLLVYRGALLLGYG